MRRLFSRFFVVAACALSLVGCKDKGPVFTVEGTISGADGKTLVVYHRSLSGIDSVNAVTLGSDGKYRLEVAAPDAPDFYLLRLDDQWIPFSADSTETITIDGKMPGLAWNYSVKGSESSEMIRQVTQKHNRFQQRVYELERNLQLMGQPMADSLERMLAGYKDSLARAYIYPGMDKAYAYYALQQEVNHLYWNPQPLFNSKDERDIRIFQAVATQWKQFYGESARAQQLVNQVETDLAAIRQSRQNEQELMEKTEVVTAGHISLTLPDSKGQLRSMDELSGKVVLLAFHHFNNENSPGQIIKLRELYGKYHDRGLEIYQVGIDADDHFWRQAVENLPWVCVYDPYATSLRSYNVDPRALPVFFLIQRNGDLWGERLFTPEDIERALAQQNI